MRGHTVLILDGSERVRVEWDEVDDDDDDEQCLSLQISSSVTLTGPASVMQAWANEIQLAVSTA